MQEGGSRSGQARPCWAAFDQTGAYVGFQCTDRLAERRLAQAESAGSAVKTAGFGQHVEVVEMAQVHDPLTISVRELARVPSPSPSS
ncbi:hypothetical protein [Azospirillum doebereinerae]